MSAAFLAKFPQLFHVTDQAALPSIQRRGLLSAAALVQASGLEAARHAALLEQNRRHWTTLPCGASLRLQMMGEVPLRARLDENVETAAWRRFINGMVFFCTTAQRAWRLHDYEPTRQQIVLQFETASLLETGCALLTCRFNNGAIDRSAEGKRRRRHFADYRDVAAWKRGKPAQEVAIPNLVPALVQHRVVQRQALQRAGKPAPG